MGNDKFQNKYRIASARLPNWDYTSNGAYFITICTKDRIPYFGRIENKKMILSNMGIIADLMWHEIKNHAKNIELGEFVVMPDHIRGILILNGGDGMGIAGNAIVETLHATSLPSSPQSPSPSSPQSPPPIVHVPNGKNFTKIKFRFYDYSFLQIGRYKTWPPIRVSF